MNPQRLALFSAIVHAGSLSKAAATLGMGKSVVSRQLAKLEDELGTRLIQRSTRKLTLTEIGELVFAEALHIDRAVSNIEQLTAPGVTVSRFCASGLEACNQAAAQVMSGQADLVVGGGVESMSRVPMFSSGGAWPIDPQVAAKTAFVPQGISADLIATKWGFSRQDVDAYALESQRRAKAAWDAGRFAKSIVPVKDINSLTMLASSRAALDRPRSVVLTWS